MFDVSVDGYVGITSEGRFGISSQGNHLGAFPLDRRNDRDEFVGFAGIGNADHDVVFRDHTQVAVRGFGCMDKVSGRSG